MIAKFSRKFIQLTLFVLRKTWHKKSTPFPLPKSKFEERNTTEVRSGSSDFWWNYFQTECHNEISIYTHLFVWNKTSSCIVLTIKTLRKKKTSTWQIAYIGAVVCGTLKGQPQNYRYLQFTSVHGKLIPFLPVSEISQTADFCAVTPSNPCVSTTVPMQHASFVCIERVETSSAKSGFFISEHIHLIFLLLSLAT